MNAYILVFRSGRVMMPVCCVCVFWSLTETSFETLVTYITHRTLRRRWKSRLQFLFLFWCDIRWWIARARGNKNWLDGCHTHTHGHMHAHGLAMMWCLCEPLFMCMQLLCSNGGCTMYVHATASTTKRQWRWWYHYICVLASFEKSSTALEPVVYSWF